jgi:hypothetical protein
MLTLQEAQVSFILFKIWFIEHEIKHFFLLIPYLLIYKFLIFADELLRETALFAINITFLQFINFIKNRFVSAVNWDQELFT